MNNFVMSGQPLLSREELLTALHLATMHWLVRMLFCVSLQMFLPGKRLLAVGAVVDPLHLFSAGIAFLLAIAQVTLTLDRFLDLLCSGGGVGESIEEV